MTASVAFLVNDEVLKLLPVNAVDSGACAANTGPNENKGSGERIVITEILRHLVHEFIDVSLTLSDKAELCEASEAVNKPCFWLN